MEAWLGEARAALIELEDELNADEAAKVEYLIDHGEPAVGLLSLAWTLDNKDVDTSPTTRSRIRWLAGDLVEEDLWPSRWQSE